MNALCSRRPLGCFALLWVLWHCPALAVAALEQETTRGPVTALVKLEPETIRIGDSVDFTIEVKAQAGVELLLPEFGQALDQFPILDFTPKTRVDADGTTVATHRYRLQPNRSGELHLPAIMIEFVDQRPGQRPAPDGEDAYELLTQRLSFTVASVVPDSAAAELHPPRGELLEVPAITPDRAALLTIAAIGCIALVAAAVWWRYRQRRPPLADPYDVAMRRLSHLRALPADALATPEQMDAFFVELTDIVRRYVEGRFGLHAPELTTEEFLDAAAASPDLSAPHRGFLSDFLQNADQVKFAGLVPSADVATTALSAIGQFLTDTRTDPVALGEGGHA
ncbi:MAG: hypothetical protein GKR94_28480 [Gammaproteobacteria bacterium]|nr:hypothetical protein [Gammaproteobacteria bacterium]